MASITASATRGARGWCRSRGQLSVISGQHTHKQLKAESDISHMAGTVIEVLLGGQNEKPAYFLRATRLRTTRLRLLGRATVGVGSWEDSRESVSSCRRLL